MTKKLLAGAVAAVLALLLVSALRSPGRWARGGTAAGGEGEAERAARAAGAARSAIAGRRVEAAACAPDLLLGDLRAARSPAYRRYLARALADAAGAGAISTEALLERLARERDPAVLEAIAGALVAQANAAEDPRLLRPLLDRLSTEGDPALRAAIVRGLEGTVEPSSRVIAGLGTSYDELIRDPAPEVREAVVDNLLAENGRGYGQVAEIADDVVAAARAATDPAATARLVGAASIEKASPASVAGVAALLGHGEPEVREAAAAALGSVGAEEAARTMAVLVARYRAEEHAPVKKAILAAIARVGFAGAAPVLESLRGGGAELDREIDLWLAALATGRQTWLEVLAQKQRLESPQGA